MSTDFRRATPCQVGALLVSALVVGCASTPPMTLDEVMANYESIATLERGVRQASAADAEVLAPEGYASAAAKLDEAIAAARDANPQQARSLAASGIKGLDKINQDLEKTRDVLREILTVRARAEEVGAAEIYPERTRELEDSLRETAALLERGKLEDAKRRRQELIDGYSKLELDALKGGIVEAAKATIASAEKAGAKKYAPKTFKAANEELGLALSILDADRTETDKANVHAKRAMFVAKQSAGITELIKDMDRRKFDREEVVRWYQDQLTEIYQPLGGKLPFDQSNRDVVLGMQNAYSELIAERDTLAAAKDAGRQQLEQTEEQLVQKNRMDEDERKRFEAAQSMFTPAEANVYRQLENVLISAHGFDFPSGQSEINTDNFVLLNKVIRVIALFPGSTIEVSGHTDSTGSAELNLELSKRRAGNVAKFLNEVGGITVDRLSSEGFGKERPVASNETLEGRASNRRVEILIVNP